MDLINRSLSIVTLALMAFSTDADAQCYARHWFSGQFVLANEQNGPTSFWAQAGWAPDGWPVITYGSLFYGLPPLMQKFTKIHECFHVSIPTISEVEANCRALIFLRSNGLSKSEEDFIGQYHMQPAYDVLPPQYGGSGKMFWNMTLTCAGPH